LSEYSYFGFRPFFKPSREPDRTRSPRHLRTATIALLFVPAAKLIARLRRTIETELAIRQAISELNEMNDHMLRDIGLTRGEIEHAMRGLSARHGTDGSSFGGRCSASEYDRVKAW